MVANHQRKEETRRRMLEAANRSFRAEGYAGIGVDGIAKAAGATSGAFYAHFGSKKGAFEAALEAGLEEVIVGVPRFQADHGANWLMAFADYYLGPDHLADLAGGCAMTTLSPEVVRAEPDLQQIYATKMESIVTLMAKGLEGGSLVERKARAWSCLSSLIGGLTLARAMGQSPASGQIASAAKSAALGLAGPTRDGFPPETG